MWAVSNVGQGADANAYGIIRGQGRFFVTSTFNFNNNIQNITLYIRGP